MCRRLRAFLTSDSGTLLATEWVFVATILLLGAASALVTTRSAVQGQRAQAYVTLK